VSSEEEDRLRKIKEIILQHKGKAKAIKSKSIALTIGINEDDTHIGTRNLITKLIKDGLPIGACDNGYFLLETQPEVDEYSQILNGRMLEIYDRIVHIQNNFNMFYGVNNKPAIQSRTEEDEDEDIL
jgi:hypothetical protein